MNKIGDCTNCGEIMDECLCRGDHPSTLDIAQQKLIMSDKINIQAILAKHPLVMPSGVAIGQAALLGQTNWTAAIKEIVEAVVDKCAEEAEAIEGYNTGFSGNAASVDKQSILNVKNMINYDS